MSVRSQETFSGRKLTLDRIRHHAEAHAPIFQIEAGAQIDLTRPFVCPTLTPLYYTESYAKLTPAAALRYNQITAMYFNEVVAFFETSFAIALDAATALTGRFAVSDSLKASIATFKDDEARHARMWRQLNRLAAPQWYGSSDDYLVVVPAATTALLGLLAGRPHRFPVVIWLMLALEERSMEISRRCGRMSSTQIEPHFAAAYRAHMIDEVRHIQIDWHLLEHFVDRLTPAMRRLNSWIFRQSVARFLLKPAKSSLRVLDLLAEEFPELRHEISVGGRQITSLDSAPGYRETMYSPHVTPITFHLAEKYPEFRSACAAPPAGASA